MKVLALANLFGSEEAQKKNLYSGVSYYRQLRPFQELGWEVDFWQPPVASEKQLLTTMDLKIQKYDLVLTKQLDNAMAIQIILAVCDAQNKPLIIDFDDHLLTDDGKIAFRKQSYPGESEARSLVEVYIQNCTAVTVSVPGLVDVYKKYNKNVFVVPNLCYEKDWKEPKTIHADKRPTIGWFGTSSHQIDHEVIEGAMKRVIEKYPDVVFSSVGHYNPEQIKFLPRHNWALAEPITYWDDGKVSWPKYLAEQGYDIGLAPLIDSQTNQNRSLCKWFEYTMTDTPVIASNIGPYRDLHHQEDALLCVTEDDWVENINTLLEHPELRDKYVESAKRRIKNEFSPKARIHEWRNTFTRFGKGGFRFNSGSAKT
jgi:glycosyltransferase involved in cell wall biosynthesis